MTGTIELFKHILQANLPPIYLFVRIAPKNWSTTAGSALSERETTNQGESQLHFTRTRFSSRQLVNFGESA